MKGIFRIPSQLYFDLWTKGNEIPSLTGDKLIAVYSILKFYRDNGIKYYAYKSKNNKNISGYALLRAKTNISLHTIEKYVPVLIEMGLCFIDNNGDFVLLGNQKTKDLYSSYKLVPIKIGKNVTDTALNVMFVRVDAKDKEEQKQYRKKLTRSVIISQGVNPQTSSKLRDAKKTLKRFGEITYLNEKTVLSNGGFAVLKHGAENDIKHLKSSGSYWKKRLKDKGLITTKRQFTNVEQMSYDCYLNLKRLGFLEKSQTYRQGYLVNETASAFYTIKSPIIEIETEVLVPAEKEIFIEYNKKPYLQFDMIDFWINSGK